MKSIRHDEKQTPGGDVPEQPAVGIGRGARDDGEVDTPRGTKRVPHGRTGKG
jgi:hypothetical protein